MKSIFLKLLVFGLFIFICNTVFAQPRPRVYSPTREDIVKGQLEQRMANMRISGNRVAKRKGRNGLSPKPIVAELTEELKLSLKPDPNLINAYSNVLGQPNTGIIKLFDLPDCKQIKKRKKKRECRQKAANIQWFANSFSFRENQISKISDADLLFRKKHFVGGRHSVQTILVNLGDVAIEKVDLNTSGISFLKNFKPQERDTEVDAQFDFIKNGVSVQDYSSGEKDNIFSYGKVQKIEKNKTYAIRSIAYRSVKEEILKRDKDLIVVFRVLDFGNDDSVTFLWKVLNEKEGMVMTFKDDEPALEVLTEKESKDKTDEN